MTAGRTRRATDKHQDFDKPCFHLKSIFQNIIFQASLRRGAGAMRHAATAQAFDNFRPAADKLTRAAEQVDARRPQADACRIARAARDYELTQAPSHELGFRFWSRIQNRRQNSRDDMVSDLYLKSMHSHTFR